MVESPRKKAVKILIEIEKNSAYSNIEMNKLRASNLYSDLDARFIGELVNGVIKRKITLDKIIAIHSKVKINKIAPFVLNVLRIGIYQIIYMNKVPDSAAVNECVKIIKKSSVSRLSSYVNAVLRAVSIDDLESFSSDSPEDISVRYSFPLWLANRWINQFGCDFTKSLMDCLNNKPSLFVRRCNHISADELINKLKAENVTASKVLLKDFEDFDYGIRIDKFANLESIKSFSDADFYIQDPAAALAAYVMEPKSGETVIDMCSAPGGKSLFMAELMNNCGKIYSFDIYEHKIKLINENKHKYNAYIVEPELNDATVYNDKYCQIADRILCDVPCSGLGIIQKKPDIRYKRTEKDIQSLSDLSLKILNNAAKYLKPGGTLVFSTCTIDVDENEKVMKKFLLQNPDFKLYPYGNNKISYKTFYPNVDGTDGFFICRLQKLV